MFSTRRLRGGYGPGAYVAPATAVVEWIDSGRRPAEHLLGALAAISQLFCHALSVQGDEWYDSTVFGQRMSGIKVANDVLVALKQLEPTSETWLSDLRSLVRGHSTTVSELMQDNDIVFPDDRLDRFKVYLDELVRQGRVERSAQAVAE